MKKPLPTRIAIAACVAAAALATETAHAQAVVPADKSTLYYRIGGGEPVSRPANPATAPIRIGLNGTARLAYSCGHFDVDVTVENLMNGFAAIGTRITGAVRADRPADCRPAM